MQITGEKNNSALFRSSFFLRTYASFFLGAYAHISSLVSRSEAEARKNGCDARARGQRFTMETGARDVSRRRVTIEEMAPTQGRTAPRGVREGGFDNFLQFASRRHMPLNSRGLRRYKVYKDLRPSCIRTSKSVFIYTYIARGRGRGLHVAAGCRDKSETRSQVFHCARATFHSVAYARRKKRRNTAGDDGVRLVYPPRMI